MQFQYVSLIVSGTDVCVIFMPARVATAVAAGSILAYVTRTTDQ